MARKLEEIQVEFNQTCAILGDLVFKSRQMELDKGRLVKRIKDLQKEAQRVSDKTPKSEEPAKEVTAEVVEA